MSRMHVGQGMILQSRQRGWPSMCPKTINSALELTLNAIKRYTCNMVYIYICEVRYL